VKTIRTTLYWTHSKKLVRVIEPDYVVMENVHGVYHSEIYQSFEADMNNRGTT